MSSVVFGQSDKSNDLPCIDKYPEESVVLITDRDYYIAGEQIWFKAFVFLDHELSSAWSKVLYVELFSHEQNALVRQKFELASGMTDNVIDIPQNINTGHYFLRAYTQYNRNLPPEKVFTKLVSIVNPESTQYYIEEAEKSEADINIEPDQLSSTKPIKINLGLAKKQFKQREKVDLTLDGSVPAHLTIAVRKKGTAYDEQVFQGFIRLNPWLNEPYLESKIQDHPDLQEIKTGNGALAWIPEIRGLSLTGKIQNKLTKKPVPGVYCITSVIGKEPQVHLSKTNENGDFVFTYNHLQGEKDIFIAIRNSLDKNLEILINKDFNNSFPPLQAIPFPFDSSRHKLFGELYLNHQLRMAFPVKETEEPIDDYSTFNLGAPDFTVDIQEFIYIPTLEEIFTELIPTVSVKGKIGSRKLYVYDKGTYSDLDNPLVLLDNVPVNDIENMLLIEPSKLSAIEVYNSEYRLGDYSFGGIISLKTQTEDFGGFKWTDNSVFLNFKTINRQSSISLPGYSAAETRSDRRPDFRTILYWNPSLHLKRLTEQLSFYTSDHLSEYEIVVRGYTSDGRPCFGNIDFTVEK